MTAAPPIRLRLLGTVPYTEALTRMRQWTAARQAARPPVVPARRAGNATGTGGRPHLTLVGSGRSWSHAPCTPSAAGAAPAADSPTSLTRPALCLNWPELHDAATAGDEIWLMQHPPVFTLGMNSQPGHLLDPGDIPVVPTERGGQITYHGPGQIMAYLMLDLRTRKLGIRVLVERIENALIQCLMHYGVTAIRQAGAPGIYVLPRHPAQAFVQPFEALQACSGSAGLPMAGSAQVTSPAKAACTGSATGPNGALGNSGASTITGMAHAGASGEAGSIARPPPAPTAASTGPSAGTTSSIAAGTGHHPHLAVVPPPAPRPHARHARPAPGVAKIASIGLKASHGFSYHGLALNAQMDLAPFSRINPCGFQNLQMTDIHRESASPADIDLDALALDLGHALIQAIEGYSR